MVEVSKNPNEMQMELPSCPMCTHATAKQVYSWPEYAVVRCNNCDFFYLSPRPTEAAVLEIYKQDGYYDGEAVDGYDNYVEQEEALRLTFRKLMRNLDRRRITGGHLLEVGCGYGYLLEAAAPWFETRHGTDFSPRAVERASKVAQQVFHGGLDQIPEDSRYDCIITNHVIEHVYDPETFVSDLLAKLRPGGHLLVATPDMGSFWRHLMGKRWPSFKFPEHVLYFDRKSLGDLLTRCGLQKIEKIPYAHAFPLSLIGAKLGLKIDGGLGRLSFWLPKTTLALWGRKPMEDV